MRASLKLVCATALMAAGTPAFAGHFLFTLSGDGYSASGTLTTDDASGQPTLYPCAGCVSGPGYLVTDITGTINGDAITGVAPLNSVAGNNNRIYLTETFLDWGDLGFQTASHLYNVYDARYYTGQPGLFLAVDPNGPRISNISFSLSAAPVPEAGSWAMMAAGFGLAGGALRARRKGTPATA